MVGSAKTDLMLAILAMDSYNRGYGEGITGLGGLGSHIGDAIISTDSETTSSTKDDAQDAGFYAVAYELSGETIISYRGTDVPAIRGSGTKVSDLWSGWVGALGVRLNILK